MRKVLRMLAACDREKLNEEERAELAAALLSECRPCPGPIRRFLWALASGTAAVLAIECEEPEGVTR
jgi:hypothetical protein